MTGVCYKKTTKKTKNLIELNALLKYDNIHTCARAHTHSEQLN